MEPRSPEPSLVERTGVLAGEPGTMRERDAALGALTTVRADALAPLVRAVAVGDAHALTHLVPAAAVELAALRERVPLRPGHVVAVLVAVLDALDALHRAHLAHGGVAAERVLVAPDGSVVLAGSGLAWSVPPGFAGGPVAADDVADVAVLARRLLGSGSAPPALVLALLRAADPDPALRPGAAALAASVRAALPDEPLLDLLWLAAPRAPAGVADVGMADVAVVDVAPGEGDAAATRSPSPVVTAPALPSEGRLPLRPQPGARRRRGRPRTLLTVAALLALPLVAAGALRLPTGASADPADTGPSPSPSASPSSEASSTEAPATDGPAVAPPPATDWVAVLRSLDDRRHRALVTGSASLLAAAVDPRGSAWAADSALVARVRSTGARMTGGALVPSSVELVEDRGSSVRLRVRDVRTAYDVTAGGTTTHVAARGARTWEVTLRSSGTGWRISDVSAARSAGQ
ncbi:MAG: hypothetical protein U0R76_04535 [Candidatus Nanopelagicales bacterium]